MSVAPGSSVTNKRVVLMSQNFYVNRIVDAWNSLLYTAVSTSSINSFKRKLREVNLDRLFNYCGMILLLYAFFFFVFCTVLYYTCVLVAC